MLYIPFAIQKPIRRSRPLLAEERNHPARCFYNDQPPDMLFYQGLAWLKLGDQKEAHRRFHTLISYGEQHLFDHVSIDYFAVSLPDFLVFEDDLHKRNQTHCYYMLGLGYLGLRDDEQARSYLERVLEMESNHQGARVHLTMLA